MVETAVLHQRERKASAPKSDFLVCLPDMSRFRNRVAITYVPFEDTWNGILHAISIGSLSQPWILAWVKVVTAWPEPGQFRIV